MYLKYMVSVGGAVAIFFPVFRAVAFLGASSLP